MNFQFTPMVRNLLIINAGILFAAYLTKIDLNQYMGLRNPGSGNFFPTQYFTYMFAHGGVTHLLGNCISILIFAPLLEKVWGSGRFLTFYLVCGLGGGILYSAVHYYEVNELRNAGNAFLAEPSYTTFRTFEQKFGSDLIDVDSKEKLDADTPDPVLVAQCAGMINTVLWYSENGIMVGASGAVFGIMMAMLMLFPNTEIFRFSPFPIKVKYLVIPALFMALKMGLQKVPGDQVAHYGHLGGALFGFILVKYWQKQRNTFY